MRYPLVRDTPDSHLGAALDKFRTSITPLLRISDEFRETASTATPAPGNVTEARATSERALLSFSHGIDRAYTLPVGTLPQQCQPWSGRRTGAGFYSSSRYSAPYSSRALIGLASLGLTTVAGFIKRHRSSDVPYPSFPNGTPIVRLAQAHDRVAGFEEKRRRGGSGARADVAITMTSASFSKQGGV